MTSLSWNRWLVSLSHNIKCLGGRNTLLTRFTILLEFSRESAAGSFAYLGEMIEAPSCRNHTPSIFFSKGHYPSSPSHCGDSESIGHVCGPASELWEWIQLLTPVVPQIETWADLATHPQESKSVSFQEQINSASGTWCEAPSLLQFYGLLVDS